MFWLYGLYVVMSFLYQLDMLLLHVLPKGVEEVEGLALYPVFMQ